MKPGRIVEHLALDLSPAGGNQGWKTDLIPLIVISAYYSWFLPYCQALCKLSFPAATEPKKSSAGQR
jgi:hypothetical protein